MDTRNDDEKDESFFHFTTGDMAGNMCISWHGVEKVFLVEWKWNGNGMGGGNETWMNGHDGISLHVQRFF
jgi:hypothetical protein